MKRNTLWMVLLFAGLLIVVGVVAFWPAQAPQPPLHISGWAHEAPYKEDEVAPIDKIEIRRHEASITLNRMENDRWSMDSLRGAVAERYRVRQILSLFRDDIRSVIASPIHSDGQLEEFGLLPEEATTIVLSNQGEVFANLEIGKEQRLDGSMGETDSFVRIPGQPRVYRLIGKNFSRMIPDEFDGLRDRRPLHMNIEDIVSLKIENPALPPAKRVMALTSYEQIEEPVDSLPSRIHRVYRFVEPSKPGPADVRAYLSTLTNLYAQEYLQTLPDGIELDGLDIEIDLTNDQKEHLRLSQIQDDVAYGQVDSVDGYFRISKHTARALYQSEETIRDNPQRQD